jgi:hypothetical protein
MQRYPDRKSPEAPGTWQDNIEMYLKEMRHKSGSGQRPVAGSTEQGNESLKAVKRRGIS